jgi:hypothetical protein
MAHQRLQGDDVVAAFAEEPVGETVAKPVRRKRRTSARLQILRTIRIKAWPLCAGPSVTERCSSEALCVNYFKPAAAFEGWATATFVPRPRMLLQRRLGWASSTWDDA